MSEQVGSTILAIRRAGEKLAQAAARELEVHSLRGIKKSEAIVRLIGTPNAETSTESVMKPHSATSAEKVVESDKEYAAHLAACRQSVVDRILAEAELEVAVLSAQLTVKLATVEA